jgi:hypothetical protein
VLRAGSRSLITLVMGMARRPPRRVALDHDDYAAEYVGRTADGRQFFLTNPFVPAYGDRPGREFLALYLFDENGKLLEARIEDLGTRAELDEERARLLEKELLASLGEVSFGRIWVVPFQIERFGVEFGFIAHPPDEINDDWYVTVEPGDYMAFYPPWNEGWYDT